MMLPRLTVSDRLPAEAGRALAADGSLIINPPESTHLVQAYPAPQ